MYSFDWRYFIDPFLNRFASPNVRVCQSRQINLNFSSESHKTKISTCNRNRINHNYFFSAETLEIPKNDVEYFQVMFKSLESLRECAQLLSTSFHENKQTCQLSEVEIKTSDFLFQYKQCDSFIFLFTYQVLAFFEFPVGTSIRTQTRNLPRGDAKST